MSTTDCDTSQNVIDLDLDFTFWDNEKRKFGPLFTDQRKKLFHIMNENYPQCVATLISPPYCIVECNGFIPPESLQCFMAAGLICYFMVVGEPLPFGSEFIGEYGDGDPGEVPEEVSQDLFPYHIPRPELLLGFTVVFQKQIVCVLTRDNWLLN